MASRIPRTILSLRATLPRVQVIPSRTFATLPTSTATRPTLRVTTPFVGRFKSTERSVWAKEPIISYEELKPITQQPNDDVLIVDVREPDEVSLGSIPSSVNLPLSELKDALSPNFGEGDFKKKFAFNKPLPSQNIIFFCRSGKRSASAAEQAGKNGYGNVRNYQGSWLDWQKREKESGDDY